jgi:hypothetical protein
MGISAVVRKQRERRLSRRDRLIAPISRAPTISRGDKSPQLPFFDGNVLCREALLEYTSSTSVFAL